ncbi:MAG TPA: hypothetical protein VFJ57_00760 [Solirubrobacterales bacterium]|nr:hypothetical protein [Solirubrobacterales bacterium]
MGGSKQRFGLLVALVALALGLGLAPAAGAAPGDLDPTFGSGGLVTNSIGGGVDVQAQPDGKLVTAGSQGGCTEEGGESSCHSEFLVERYTETGGLDPSFGGGDGIATVSFGNDTQAADAVIVEPGGKLLVGGTTYDAATEENQFALARLNADGTPDMSFGGGDGKVSAPVPGVESLRSWSGGMALQPDGKVVLGAGGYVRELVGEFGEEWPIQHFVLARFTAGGAVDSSYGNGGIAIGPTGNMFGLAADASGRVLAAGWVNYQFSVVRFSASGSLDNTFAGDGVASMDLSPVGSKADDVLVQPDGKILVSGYGYGYAVARFEENGTPDPSFGGGDGVVMTFFGRPCCPLAAAISVARQADGRIVFAGQWTPDEDAFADEWGIGRLFPNGTPDGSFGSGGLVTNNIDGSAGDSNDASGVAIQPDGKIVAIGSSGYPNNDFALLRLLGGGNAPQPGYQHLLISKSGPGSGDVHGSELNCGGNCGADYAIGTTVSLSAFAEGGSSFTGWTTTSGDPGTCTGTTSPCEVTLSGDVDLVAHFGEGMSTPLRKLEVGAAGSGSGTVSSSPAGINCTVFCQAEFSDGTVVTLTATPAPGSVFAGWSGPSCPGTVPCQLTMSGDRSITATFTAAASGVSGGGQSQQPVLPPGIHPAPVPLPSAKPKPRKALHCRKGFKKKRVKGQVRCVKSKASHTRGRAS